MQRLWHPLRAAAVITSLLMFVLITLAVGSILPLMTLGLFAYLEHKRYPVSDFGA